MQDFTYRLPQKRELVTELPGPISAALAQRCEAAVTGAIKPSLPGYIVDADGGVLIDADGNSFIDFASGIAVTSVGASNSRVVDAVREAVGHFTHTSFPISPYESYVAVAEKLNEITPGTHEKKSVLFNSGAEAVENAVKISRAYTGRRAVVVFDNAYHGRTNLTMAMTAKNKPYKTGFGPFASDVIRVPMSYPLRDQLSGADAAAEAIRAIELEVGAENLACVVIEPIQGEGGFIVPADGFLPAISQWCTDNNVVFIADEIQAGMCRTGAWFAVDHEGVVPDLITTAKGIAAGMPLSAVTGRAEIMDAPVVGGLGGTYTGNPVACAAALASLAEMEEHNLSGRAREIESMIREILEPLTSEGTVAEVRGRGGMVALELIDAAGKPAAALTATVAAELKSQGILILTCGMDGNVIRLLPSLVISEDLLREGLDALAASIRANA
ncbi:4-aminobutyrate--2-oxoglutarate transaminase [Corynebacterium testudinoris]|uniref:(S)-3-amino-2-methylpropionate transaminase n=1 Tax=Corynebacterium testudinoris TaxID=136857 RepID=A0A0G3HAS8_9CORY|nr:4-aminobutyrate--2-oxoglutarate transaminase [Corynebacterium testudinoris]AKK08247.1 4-aminobutyrate aminotransferase apoenzyme [Corynebacterium testudinoris]MBX8995691.1 4-aminobutyrate--2-oxoglutarate transaminase [Corynebacterium testudinoris]